MQAGEFVDKAVQFCIALNNYNNNRTPKDEQLVKETVSKFNEAMSEVYKNFNVRLQIKYIDHGNVEVIARTIRGRKNVRRS